MKIPDNIERLKPNQIVVFDRYYKVNGTKANALAATEDGFIVFDTEAYHTDGKVSFLGGKE